MHEDAYYLLFCLFLFILTLAIRVYLGKNRKKTIVIHVSMLIVYSLFCWYNLKYNGAGGSSLVWLIGWMFLIGVHCFILLTEIVIILLKKKGRQ